MIEKMLLTLDDQSVIEEHHLAGFLYQHHRQLLNKQQLKKWKSSWKQQWVLNQNMKGLLDRIGPFAQNNGINLIALKGMALLPQIYQDFGSRKLSDIDLALLPVGGTYTMDAEQAAQAVSQFKPKRALAYHWGDIVGSRSDAEEFLQLADCDVDFIYPGESAPL